MRLSATALALLYGLVVALPGGAQATEPVRGRLGAGLAAVAQGQAPDRAIQTRMDDGERKVAVSVELAGDPDPAIRGRLRAAGLDLRGSWGRTIEGYVRPGDLERLAGTPWVRAVRAIRAPLPGTFVGPAPAIHGATAWQQARYTGEGVKVGILDVGFGGIAALLGTELPAAIQALCFAELGVASSSLADCGPPDVFHGTAVAESIIDMAPGASLYVSNAESPADMAAAVRWMTAAGVRVINFSQGSAVPEGMGDGTSPDADSTYGLVDLAVARGALFVASAGNQGLTSWMGEATDADSNRWLEFAPGDEADSVTLRAGQEITAGIRWGSAASDYDLSIWQGDTMLAESAEAQALTGDPAELISFTAPSSGTYSLSIWRASGPVAPRMRLFVNGTSTPLTYRTTFGSLSSPADSRNPGMVTVGAVDYRTPTVIEPYSSVGPTLDGRIKPDLVAVDCAPTTILPVFCGTSQSTPFVSGAAALLLEADPTLTPVALVTVLKERATPIGAPVPNNVFGAGLLSLGQLPTAGPVAATFVAPPASGITGSPLAGQPTVGVVDAGGRIVVTGPGATQLVTLSLATNPTGATLACEGGNVKVAAAGIADFSGCAVDQPGVGYTLRADIAGLVSATSAPFSVLPIGSPPAASITIGSTAVVAGKSVAGTVSMPSTTGLPGLVTVEWSKDRRVWSPVGDVVVDALGFGSFSLAPTTSRWLRARIARFDGAVDVSPSRFVRVNATAVLASSLPTGRTVDRSTKITLTETIRPVGAGVAAGRARFDFFLRVGTAWVRKRTLYANADPTTGRARLVTTLPLHGRWWIRSRAEPTATNGASAWTAGFRYLVR